MRRSNIKTRKLGWAESPLSQINNGRHRVHSVRVSQANLTLSISSLLITNQVVHYFYNFTSLTGSYLLTLYTVR